MQYSDGKGWDIAGMRYPSLFVKDGKVNDDMITNEHIAGYIDSLESELPEYLRLMEEAALADEVPIIKKPAQSLLRFLIKLNQPVHILEVGAAVGFSSSFMSAYMPSESKLVTIEKMPERIEVAKINFLKVPRKEDITLLTGDAIDVLGGLCDKKEALKDGGFDFIFMDAAKGQYMNFLPFLMKLLLPGGVLVTDNVLQEGSIADSKFSIPRRERTIHLRMREYLYTITHMEELETVVLPVGDGVSVSYRIKDVRKGMVASI